jgi:ribonuclease D
MLPMEEPLRDPIWIAEESALKALLKDLESQSIIAVDTESNSLFAYHEQVCLIQFTSGGRDYLVDPLEISVLICLTRLWPTLQSKRYFTPLSTT